jgi:hypothetical protein
MTDAILSREESITGGERWSLVLIGFAFLSLFLTDEWLIGASLLVLWVVWRFLPTLEGPPVLSVALTFQWIQVVAGVYYHALTGRELIAIEVSNYRPMVMIGLVCILTLVAGIRLGFRVPARTRFFVGASLGLEWHDLAIAYIAFILFSSSIQTLAWQMPSITQSLLALNFLRYGVVFLIFRRLLRPPIRWGWIAAILLVEVGMGATGYFAGFREPLMILGIALVEVFDYHKLRNWVTLGILASLTLLSSLVWTGIKVAYRAEFADADFAASREARTRRLATLVSDWFDQDSDRHLSDVDRFIDRIWPIYYPALALTRVPDPIPHTNGQLLWGAITHVLTPRMFFPDKENVRSDSELVRQYSGISVDNETSMAFGYAGEAYVDFGLPGMFVPILIYGFAIGLAVSWLLKKIHTKELSVSIVTVIAWLSLYLFERSWIFMIGLAGTLIVCLGGAGILVDTLLERRQAMRASSAAGHLVPEVDQVVTAP